VATLVEEALKQMEQTGKNPLVVVEQMPDQTDHVDILRKGHAHRTANRSFLSALC
jgi:Mrp family chromosome partitioning ATPase